METNTLNDQQEGTYQPELPATENNQDNQEPNEASSEEQVARKKYHSSAMYAASKWHNTIDHVKPKHPGLNL